MALAKAKLKAIENQHPGPDEITFLFNPTKLQITAQGKWEQPPQGGNRQASKPQYKGPEPRTMKFDMLLDEWDEDGQSGFVTRTVNTLIDWTRPTDQSRGQNVPQPPVVQLIWGGPVAPERCYLQSVDATFTLFHHDTGKPLRATVNISMKEIPPEPRRQNPTSGSLTARRSHLVVEGDSLQSVAWREYQNPTYWRALAQANRIDDPLRVRPGRRLYIPPMDEARELTQAEG